MSVTFSLAVSVAVTLTGVKVKSFLCLIHSICNYEIDTGCAEREGETK